MLDAKFQSSIQTMGAYLCVRCVCEVDSIGMGVHQAIVRSGDTWTDTSDTRYSLIPREAHTKTPPHSVFAQHFPCPITPTGSTMPLVVVTVLAMAAAEIVSAKHRGVRSQHPLYDRRREVENKWSRQPTAKGELRKGEIMLVDGVHLVKVKRSAKKVWHIRMPTGKHFVRRLYSNGEKPPKSAEPSKPPPDSHPLYDRAKLVENTWSWLAGSEGELREGETILVDGVHRVKVERSAKKGWHIRMPGNGFVRRLYPNGENPSDPRISSVDDQEPFKPPPPGYSPRPPPPPYSPRPTTTPSQPAPPPQEPTSRSDLNTVQGAKKEASSAGRPSTQPPSKKPTPPPTTTAPQSSTKSTPSSTKAAPASSLKPAPPPTNATPTVRATSTTTNTTNDGYYRESKNLIDDWNGVSGKRGQYVYKDWGGATWVDEPQQSGWH